MLSTAEYKNAHPDQEQSEASSKAKRLEQEIYSESKSQVNRALNQSRAAQNLTPGKLEYEEKCNGLLEGLQRQSKFSITDLIKVFLNQVSKSLAFH